MGRFGGTKCAVLEAPGGPLKSHHVGRFGGTMHGWTVLEAPGGPFLRHQVDRFRGTWWAVYDVPVIRVLSNTDSFRFLKEKKKIFYT